MRTNRFLILLLSITAALLISASSDLPPTPASAEIKTELSAAFFRRLQDTNQLSSLTFELFSPELDTAFTSPDGETAVLWLALRDDFGRLLATEPGLAVAYRASGGWQVLLPGDPGWEETLAALPKGMLPAELSPPPESAEIAENAVNTLYGYYLPYAAGTARWLEGSISHFQYIPELGYPSCDEVYCRYAYDFTDSWQFPLLASKDGTVIGTRDSCADGDPGCTNYIVLRNSSDGAYQIYLHLANRTIPDKLTNGAQVKRGQYIGDTDDTGYSTSQHVHFMVTKSIWTGNGGYPWGYSVDVRFADVAINNGIPRTCYEVTHFQIYDGATECLGNRADPRNPANDWFVSGNVGAYPPTGSLTRPAAGVTVNSGANPLIDVTANASDDVSVAAVRLVARLSGQWAEVGPKITQPASPEVYDWDVDLCAVGPLNGPLEVGLRVWDYEGNMSSILSPRTIQVDHACPPPNSQLNPAESFDSTAVRLSWIASSAGAGLGSFELQWSTAPGVWDSSNRIVLPGSQRSVWFGGQPGRTTYFRLRALDINGQPESWPANNAAETSVTLPTSCAADEYEPDDEYTQARQLLLGEWAQSNLCGASDPDWFKISPPHPEAYFIAAASLNGGAAVRLTVYAEDAETLLASGEAAGIAMGTAMKFTPEVEGVYYIKVEPLTEDLFGTDAWYRIVAAELRASFMPLVGR